MRFPVASLRSLLAAFLSERPATITRRRKPAARNLPIECLEPRQFLSATQVVFTTVPASGFLGSTLSPIVVQLEDAGNHVVTNDNSKVTLTLHSEPNGGKILGQVTVSAVAGVATFDHLKFSTLGTYTLTATDASESLTSTPSGNVIIQAPPFPQTLVVSQPANNTQGSLISTVTVQVKDQYGNLFTSGHPMVSLSLVNPATGAKLLGDTHVSAVNGIATFTGLSLNESGTFELRATEGSGTHSLAMTTATFTVTAPSVAHTLAFGPVAGTLTAGANLSPFTVKVEDQYGNVVASDHSTVKITLQSGPQAETFSVRAVNGVATFSKVAVEQAGSYKLHATDTRSSDGHSLTAADSTTFIVSAAAADHLVFQQLPANNSAHAGPFTIKAAIEDQFGNVVTSNTSTVTLALAAGPTGATLHLTAQAAAGVATFSGVTFTAAGHYRFAASDGALKATTSGVITLT